jgi:hypothetical protein
VLLTYLVDYLVVAGLLGISWAYLTRDEDPAQLSPAWIAVLIGACAFWSMLFIPAYRSVDVDIVIHDAALRALLGLERESVSLREFSTPSPIDAIWWVLQGTLAYGVGIFARRRL